MVSSLEMLNSESGFGDSVSRSGVDEFRVICSPVWHKDLGKVLKEGAYFLRGFCSLLFSFLGLFN